MEIKLTIGEKKELKEFLSNLTVKEMLELLDVPSETVVVKKNNRIVIDEELLEDGDELEVIQVIYGG
ncbi:MoaD/ThiS family protein [Methanobacterium aggregans]|uniref:MoaD/ThiS family protein n=1 Tax=Methanobacterium aggregans TaxID=1615586 RepID=UPI001AE88936|nr:MoaD/ThiS family protein [Methanobacterium aggregans]MBP2047032.1 sulfur carrier protein [Methanobacterium aggregans]